MRLLVFFLLVGDTYPVFLLELFGCFLTVVVLVLLVLVFLVVVFVVVLLAAFLVVVVDGFLIDVCFLGVEVLLLVALVLIVLFGFLTEVFFSSIGTEVLLIEFFFGNQYFFSHLCVGFTAILRKNCSTQEIVNSEAE